MKINDSDLLNYESPSSLNPKGNLRGQSGAAQNRAFADALRQTGSTAEVPAANQTPEVQETTVAKNPTHALLAEVARSAELSDASRSQDAVLEAARSFTRSRLGEGLQQHALAPKLVEGVSQMVFSDPVLSRNLTSILSQLKNES
jgi:hypothetical protein